MLLIYLSRLLRIITFLELLPLAKQPIVQTQIAHGKKKRETKLHLPSPRAPIAA